MFRAWTLCALLTASLLAPVATGKEVAGLELYEIEVNVINKTNAEREKHGLPPLKISRKLVESARRHTAWMTNNRALQHTSAAVGENIAMGQASSTQVVGDWMTSSGHRANILSGRYSKIGVAAYRTPQGRIYWCQQFLP